MKKILKRILAFINLLPIDVQTAVAFFIMSAVVLTASLYGLGHIFKSYEEPATVQNAICEKIGLEPYIKNQNAALGVSSHINEYESDERRLYLLARAIEKAVPNESYVIKVSFGAVLLNRVQDAAFPGSLAAVIRSAGLFPDDIEAELPERTLHAARDALLGVDPTLGALYVIYVNDERYNEFSERITAIYGSFAFSS